MSLGWCEAQEGAHDSRIELLGSVQQSHLDMCVKQQMCGDMTLTHDMDMEMRVKQQMCGDMSPYHMRTASQVPEARAGRVTTVWSVMGRGAE